MREIHVELSLSPAEFLSTILQKRLYLHVKEVLLYDDPELTQQRHHINVAKVQQHSLHNRVKVNLPTLRRVIRGDWAPKNASVTMAKIVPGSETADCEAAAFRTYFDQGE